jgi:cell division protein FtsX
MNYSTLEDAYGSQFKQRAPVTQPGYKPTNEPIAKPEFTSLEQRSQESIRKNQGLVDSLANSLPLDRNPATENFVVRQEAPVQKRMMAREHFTQSQPAGFYESQEQVDKLNRILRLIEQNRTGYERPAIQDIALYVFTGVFFLFTFDTFVELGKSMH